MPVLSDTQIIALWLKAGGSLSSAADAVARALAESSGNAAATSPNPDGGTNVGLYQLDTEGVGTGYSVSQLKDPYTNTQITVKATGNGQNWSEWSDDWTEYTSQAQAAVSQYQAKYGTKIIGGGGATPPPATSSSGATQQTQSLTSQTGDVVSQAAGLLHGAAETLNWFWQWFQPGQGWRLAFGAGAVVLGYTGLRQWGLIPSVKGIV
jgi:hypothetical protein